MRLQGLITVVPFLKDSIIPVRLSAEQAVYNLIGSDDKVRNFCSYMCAKILFEC